MRTRSNRYRTVMFDYAGGFAVHLKSLNGEIIASSEGYKRRLTLKVCQDFHIFYSC